MQICMNLKPYFLKKKKKKKQQQKKTNKKKTNKQDNYFKVSSTENFPNMLSIEFYTTYRYWPV